MNLSVSVKPASEPITAANVEESLTLDSGWDAATIAIYIETARLKVEADTDRSLITQTVTMFLDKWPDKETIHLPKGPVSALTSLEYINDSEVLTALVADTDFKLTTNGDEARIVPIGNWPTTIGDRKNVVKVVYVTGYGAAASDVPGDLKAACLAYVDLVYSKGDLMTSAYYDAIVRKNKIIFDYSIND